MFVVTATVSDKLLTRMDGKKIQPSEKSDLLAFLEAPSGNVYELISAPSKEKALLFQSPSQDYILIEKIDGKGFSDIEEKELTAFLQIRIAIQKRRVDELQLTNYRFRCCCKVTNIVTNVRVSS